MYGCGLRGFWGFREVQGWVGVQAYGLKLKILVGSFGLMRV